MDLWGLLKHEATGWYQMYLNSSPLEGLSLAVAPSAGILQAKWGRVRQRMESMIISACPAVVREGVSSARVSGVLQLLCKLHVIYKPGGLHEWGVEKVGH